MRRNFLALFIATSLLLSCSNDEDNNKDSSSENAIKGEWRAVEFQSADPNDATLNFGAEVLERLADEECYILTFDFNADLTVVVKNSVNHLSQNASATGLIVDCPTQTDTETSTYTYDGSFLTIIDQEGEAQTIEVTIDGDVMTVDAADLDVTNLDASGSLIFTRA